MIPNIFNIKNRIILIFRQKGLKILIKQVLLDIRKTFEIWKLKLKIKSFHRNYSLLELIQFIFSVKPEYLAISQNKYEIYNAIKILHEIKPQIFLEIGTKAGGTLFLFSIISSKNSKILSVDLPGGAFGGGYEEWKIPIYRTFARPTQQMYLIRDDSHKESTRKKVEQLLDSKKLDFLFIDGDHTYEGVKEDFEMYSPFVKSGGIIVFHDIVVHREDLNCSVNEFWDEIKLKYKYEEIVHDRNQGKWGIGIIYVN
jgi:cephalosporin hydroxylase